MAFTRIAKGTNSTKVSGTTLSPGSFSVNANSLIEVGVTYLSATVHPSTVKFGSRGMILVPNSRITETNSGMTTAKYRAVVSGTNTRTLTITWPSAINARACYVTEIAGAGPKDVSSTNAQVSTTNPTTGAAVTTTKAETLHICAFGSNGPVEDTVGTIQVGHVSGQRVGTTGGVAATNVTIHETYEELTATGDCRAAKISTTARRWANSITAYYAGTFNDQGLVPGEFYLVEETFEAGSKDFGKAVYGYNEDLDRWEVFEIDTSAETVIANSDDGWG